MRFIGILIYKFVFFNCNFTLNYVLPLELLLITRFILNKKGCPHVATESDNLDAHYAFVYEVPVTREIGNAFFFAY